MDGHSGVILVFHGKYGSRTQIRTNVTYIGVTNNTGEYTDKEPRKTVKNNIKVNK